VRYLVLKDFFIPLCESLLIDRYEPIWNKLIDGFGNKALGGPARKNSRNQWWTSFTLVAQALQSVPTRNIRLPNLSLPLWESFLLANPYP